MKLGYRVWVMAETSAAYIQPVPYRTAEAVNTASRSRIPLVYELQPNLRSGSYTASLGGGAAHAWGSALLTNMRLITVNWGMLYRVNTES